MIRKLVETKKFQGHEILIHGQKDWEFEQFSYLVSVVAPDARYSVQGSTSLDDTRKLAHTLPSPTNLTNTAKFLTGRTHDVVDGERKTTHYFLLDAGSATGSQAHAFEYDAIYSLEGLSSGERLESAARPLLKIVAVDETANWDTSVIDVVGRVKGVYGVNAGETDYADKWLQFLGNSCERPFKDMEEEAVEAEFARIGYGSMTDFEFDNSGEQGRSILASAISSLEHVDTMILPTAWIIEYMLEADEGTRDKMEREALNEALANGLPDVVFGDRRTDEEIVGGGLSAPDPARP